MIFNIDNHNYSCLAKVSFTKFVNIESLQHQTIINNIVMSNDKKTIKEMRANTTFMARLAKVRRVAAAL